MKWLIGLFIILSWETIAPMNLDWKFHPLAQRMEKVNPKLSADYRGQVARAIVNASIKHGVKASKLFAILAQESKFKVGAINKKSKDYGIGQINKRTIKSFNFDKNLLLTDVDYSVDAAAFVLADFKKRYHKREQDWWTRYNASKPEKRMIYATLVAQWM